MSCATDDEIRCLVRGIAEGKLGLHVSSPVTSEILKGLCGLSNDSHISYWLSIMYNSLSSPTWRAFNARVSYVLRSLTLNGAAHQTLLWDNYASVYTLVRDEAAYYPGPRDLYCLRIGHSRLYNEAVWRDAVINETAESSVRPTWSDNCAQRKPNNSPEPSGCAEQGMPCTRRDAYPTALRG